MRMGLRFLMTLALASAARAQDPAPKKAAEHAKFLELKKQLGSVTESDRLEAIKGLADVADDEAISVLAGKLKADTDQVRIAAAHAIAKHRKPASAQAIAVALDLNLQKEAVLRAFIEALTELDLCKCIPPLLALVWANKQALANEALVAIRTIGCPDAAPGLIDILRRAEAEEKKPDEFVDDEGGSEENKNKNKALAAIAGPVREALTGVTGVTGLASTRDWSTWLGGERSLKLTSIFLCEATGTTYEAPYGKSKKCPYPEAKSFHTDLFLKHQKE